MPGEKVKSLAWLVSLGQLPLDHCDDQVLHCDGENSRNGTKILAGQATEKEIACELSSYAKQNQVGEKSLSLLLIKYFPTVGNKKTNIEASHFLALIPSLKFIPSLPTPLPTFSKSFLGHGCKGVLVST